MRHRSVIFAVLAIVTVLLATTTAAAQSMPTIRRTRTSDSVVQQAIAEGYATSPTFRGLVDTIEASDVIVYIERQPIRSRGLVGMTRFVVRASNVRYVRIGLDWALLGREAIAILGHELQHAVEIAEAPWVVDRASVEQLFGAIGHPAPAAFNRYDTEHAVVIGRRVWRELHARSRIDTAPRR